MASSVASELGKRYAKALFSLAVERREQAAVGKGLMALVAACDSSEDLRRVLAAPQVSVDDKKRLMQAMAKAMNLPKTLADGLQIMAENGRLVAITAVAKAYHELELDAEGITPALAVTAAPLSSSDQKQIEAELARAVGGAVELSSQVDEAVIGGVVLRVGSRMLDMSVRSQLNMMRRNLKKLVAA